MVAFVSMASRALLTPIVLRFAATAGAENSGFSIQRLLVRVGPSRLAGHRELREFSLEGSTVHS